MFIEIIAVRQDPTIKDRVKKIGQAKLAKELKIKTDELKQALNEEIRVSFDMYLEILKKIQDHERESGS